MSEFDAKWYVSRYPEVKKFKAGPLAHYQQYGKLENKHPNEFMEKVVATCKDLDAEWYRSNNADVEKSGLDPAVHYTLYGKAEGRPPNRQIEIWTSIIPPDFDADWYVSRYRDVAKSKFSATEHYAFFGRGEGRAPNAEAELALKNHKYDPFVRALFLAVMGRQPTYRELFEYVTRLVNGSHYHYVVMSIINDPEAIRYQAKCRTIIEAANSQ
ncbi:hypothetical protein [Methylobacterium sp. P1-11]|uniref:hypothetical protein n=1 Tax=Methylobacterium sp. P1-11 TaxID=2024616 RepID=UPI0011ED8EE6|nr:hypothetical protein [Methylobacterium sp. P1-11]